MHDRMTRVDIVYCLTQSMDKQRAAARDIARYQDSELDMDPKYKVERIERAMRRQRSASHEIEYWQNGLRKWGTT